MLPIQQQERAHILDVLRGIALTVHLNELIFFRNNMPASFKYGGEGI